MHFEAVLLCQALPDPTVSIGGFIPCIKLDVCLLHCKMHNMFCCGKLCTLVLSLCDFTFYSCKGDDDSHIKQGNNELKRQFATTDR